MTETITRAEARMAGQATYFTGRPCINGHVSRRYVSTTTCLPCNIEKARRQRAAYRERHNSTKRRYSRTHVANILMASAKRRALVLGLPFSITLADISVPAVCPVLGMDLRVGDGKIHAASPTLDRVRPTLGYVPGNVVVISHRANLLKNNASIAELSAVIAWMKQKLS